MPTFSRATQSTILLKCQVSSNWTLSCTSATCLTEPPPPPIHDFCSKLKRETFMQSFFLRHASNSALYQRGNGEICNQIIVIKDSKCYRGSHHRYNKVTWQEWINSVCGSRQDTPRWCLDWYLTSLIEMHQWGVVEKSWSVCHIAGSEQMR